MVRVNAAGVHRYFLIRQQIDAAVSWYYRLCSAKNKN